jgi:hypothetical protein
MSDINRRAGADGSAATVEEIAAVEFAAMKQFRGLTRAERLRKIHDVWPMAALAIEIVGLNKSELVARVAEKYESFGPALMRLAHAADRAKVQLDLISAAECRLAVALAVVEAEPLPDVVRGQVRARLIVIRRGRPEAL